MAYASLDGTVGNQSPSDIFVPDTTQRWPLGQLLVGVDPFFGWGEFVYGSATAAHGVGRVVTLDQNFATTDVANVAGIGSPVFVAVANMAIGSFGWYAMGGNRPVQVNATVAIGAQLGVTAAGILGATSATKALQGARVLQSQTYAPTYANVQTQNGSKILFLNNINGLFVGMPVSGTGIPGSTTITALDPSQNQITLNNACTATGLITMTATWTGFSFVSLNRPGIAGTV